MNILLDTHALLWFVGADTKLSVVAKSEIESPNNRKWVSVASCWEISIKVGLGKLRLADPVDDFLKSELATNHFSLLPIELRHVTFVSTMAQHHRDPFDRLLVAQSLLENHGFVSGDQKMDAYGVNRIW
ncbi:hypothetical protein EC9_08510 [Rosistilla ulvae]|uniref:PIN domain-containing protein n=1 Tax=Rosistilla ulvae TaxID=1930277 RepID=A0A517LVP4_9BACT|nr:type II toxin-antitoxin system VapC family toxin [Rosistilla ulvae]QDS86678.1 hypothetical protein EC9_08510 [Rosistilla ulvae]